MSAHSCIYELIEYSNEAAKVTCTSLPCQWKKKSRKDTSNPSAISVLKTSLPGQSRNEAPTSEYYDPCPIIKPDVNHFYEGLKIIKPDANMLMNRYTPDDLIPSSRRKSSVIISVPSLYEQLESAYDFFPEASIEEMLEFTCFTDKDIKLIEKVTIGQSSNKLWHKYRIGMLTASKFYEITHLRPTTDPSRLIRSLIIPNDFASKTNLPPSLQWGIDHESVACKLFLKQHRALHKRLKFNERGLIIDSENFFLGATPDGSIDCEECGKFLIEIKCPYTMRYQNSEAAALANKCFTDDQGKWHLDPQSKYYSQIQGQLAISKQYSCKLIIYTALNITTIDVPFDYGFWETMKSSLVTFYLDHLGPAIINDFKK